MNAMTATIGFVDWTWQPFFPPLQIAFLAMIFLSAATWAYWRAPARPKWMALALLSARVAIMSTLSFILLGPSRIPPTDHTKQATPLAVVLDVSGSMQTDDCLGQQRLQAARERWLQGPAWDALSRQWQTSLWGFSKEIELIGANALENPDYLATFSGKETRVASALEMVLQSGAMASDNGSDLLVLTDGHDTDDASLQEVARLATARRVTVHAALFGSAAPSHDLALSATPLQPSLLPKEPGALLIKVMQTGLPQAKTTLRVKHDQQEQTYPIDFQGRESVEIQVEMRGDAPGMVTYDVSIDGVPEERVADNNRQQAFCRVEPRRLRVLLLEGEPYWDTKFIAQSLRKDERVDLTQITQVSEINRETLVSRTDGHATTIPASLSDWSNYDVVVLGRGIERVITEPGAQSLVEYVEQGGGHVILSRGRPTQESDASNAAIVTLLDQLAPVEWAPDRDDNSPSSLPAEGNPGHGEPRNRIHWALETLDDTWLAPNKVATSAAVAWSDLPPWSSIAPIGRLKPAARAVAFAADDSGERADTTRPAVIHMNWGRGQVVAMLGEGSWRWSLLPRDNEGLLGLYDQFWSNLARWLVLGGQFAPGQRAGLMLNAQTMDRGQELIVDATFKDSQAMSSVDWHVDWIDSQGASRRLAMSPVTVREPRFRATIHPEQLGVHRLVMTAPPILDQPLEIPFSVVDSNREMLDVAARPGDLQQLTSLTGGLFLPPDGVQQFLNWHKERELARHVPTAPQYIWNHLALLTVLLLGMGFETIQRRYTGLI